MIPQYGGDVLEKLQKIRKMSGKCDTHGINDDLIKNFLENDPFLSMAIDEAERNFHDLINELGEQLISLDEIERSRKMDSAIPNLEEQLVSAINMIPKAEPAIKTNVGTFVSTKIVLPIMIVAD